MVSVKRSRGIGGSPLSPAAALDARKQWKYNPGAKDIVGTIDSYFE